MSIRIISPSNMEKLKKIVKIIKTVWDMLISNSAKDASSVDSLDDNFSLDNIERITEIFYDFKEQTQQRLSEIEKAIKEEVEFYLDEIKWTLEENQEITEKYRIRVGRIKRRIDCILPHLEGVIEQEISQKISLDNSECRDIMKMIPGQKKEIALQDFINSVVCNALDLCCVNMKENLKEIYEEVSDEIIGAVEVVQRDSELQLEQLKKIDEDNFIESKTKIMSDAYYYISVCELTEEILREV